MMDRFWFLFSAYTVVWGAIFFYVWILDRRGRRMERELEDLKKRLAGRADTRS
jgi:CcmD family protein